VPAAQETAADRALRARVPDVSYRELREWRGWGVGPQTVREGRRRAYPDVDAAAIQLTRCRDLMRAGQPRHVVTLILAVDGYPVTDAALVKAYRSLADTSVLCALASSAPVAVDDEGAFDAIDAQARTLTNYVEDQSQVVGMRRSLRARLRSFNDALPERVSGDARRRDDTINLETVFGALFRMAGGIEIDGGANPVDPSGPRLVSDAEACAVAGGVDRASLEALTDEERTQRSDAAAKAVQGAFAMAAASMRAMTAEELRVAIAAASTWLDGLNLERSTDADSYKLVIALLAPVLPAVFGMLSALAS
jgi:hypothetical protein